MPEHKKVAVDRAFNATNDTRSHQVHPTDPTKTVNVSSSLPIALESTIVDFLRENWDIFVWCPADMPGIPREFAEHSLQLFPDAKPVKQTMRRIFGPKRAAVEVEVDRLLAAGFIREIKKSQWVANPVLGEKKNTDILRMCVNFTARNK